MNTLQNWLDQNSKAGVYSCCSGNSFVIRAAARRAHETGTPLLIEATANQVDQNGGYTGLTPADFYSYVMRIVDETGLPREQVILGGDHLGPLTWASLPAEKAMENACELVRAYARAGFTKIHLDASMHLLDDDRGKPLSDEVIAMRSAELCRACESVAPQPPIYVIGSEVPIPGGAQEDEDGVSITKPEAFLHTLGVFKSVFLQEGLGDAFKRVMAVVVQPGVEFGDQSVFAYDHARAAGLIAALKDAPGIVFEGHSTDYQPRACLRAMVQDGIRILKVGPALTFALREALFALEFIEKEISVPSARSDFRRTLDMVMCQKPEKWNRHYHGNVMELAYARAFSYSDRARYYLNDPSVVSAVGLLIRNLTGAQIPLTALSQYLPMQYERVKNGELNNEPQAIILDHIRDRIDDYLYAIVP